MTVVRPRKASSGSARNRSGLHHHVALQQAHVVDEDLAQALRRVCDIDSAAAVLLGHHGRLRKTRVGFLAHGGEYLEVMVDPAKLIGDLHQAELREVPDVRRQLAGDARMARGAFDVLVEVLVDAIDEDGHRRGDRAQARHQMAVGVGAAALQLARGEVEQANEVVDDAVQLFVGDQAGQAGTDLELAHRAEVLQRRQRDRRQPDLRPRQRRHAKKARSSRLKILSPIGLSSRLPAGRQAARPSRW